MPSVELSPEAYAVICGLAASPYDVNSGGIFTDAWDEIRASFPASRFHAWAKTHEGFYIEDAGT